MWLQLWARRIGAAGRFVSDVIRELNMVFKYEKFTSLWLGYALCLSTIIFVLRWEFLVFGGDELERLIYSGPWLGTTWLLAGSALPLILYVFYLLIRRAAFAQRLNPLFRDAKLVNFFDQTPSLRSVRTNDDGSKVLEVDRRGIPFERFVAAQGHLSSGLRSHVQDIRDHITRGVVRITYSKFDIPKSIDWRHCQGAGQKDVVIGQGRKGLISVPLASAPHFLVAGQTGGGKSTFLRQLICGQYLNDPDLKICLVDLKEGLEFQIFENLPRITITSSAAQTVGTLTRIDELMTKRLQLLKSRKLRDYSEIAATETKSDGSDCDLAEGRMLVVIDEFAELASTGGQLNLAEVQQCRRIVNRVSRIGRAAGIHLVIATQRPDASVLDTQIRANLPVKICFQMSDQHSSMVVLGNGSAAHLPSCPGRAIAQRGFNNIEVQTAYLSAEEAEKILAVKKKASVGIQTQRDCDQEAQELPTNTAQEDLSTSNSRLQVTV
jgi:hypothetical protein